MSNICRFDKGQLKGKAKRTDEGYIRADAIVTRTGVFIYQNPDGTLRRELRHPDNVFAADSLGSLNMIPVTVDHPEERLVTAENADRLSVGTTGEKVQVDGQHILVSLTVTHQDAVEKVDMGKKELSLGYTLDLVKEDGVYNGERYDYRQTNIKYNHLALVDRARAGGAASLNLDAGDALQIDAAETQTKPQKEQKTMNKVTLDGIQYDAAPEVANALEKANARADAAEKALTESKVALDGETAKTSKLEAERDTLKENADKATNADAIQGAVKARMELERVAGKVFNADDAKEIANMDDAAIKAKVIVEKFPNANLDGKDAVYVQARFDAAAEMVNGEKSANDQKEAMGEKHGDSANTDMGKKQADAFETMKNQHKKKEA